MKDRFSDKANDYATYRPSYPDDLFNYLYAHSPGYDAVWDAGTGNGQVATVLAGKFNRVYATDISIKQLMKVPTLPNLCSFVADESAPQIPDASVSMITVAQALHWFNVKKFANEARRISKPGALLAVWGYSLIQLPDAWQDLINSFYKQTVGPYWDIERKHIDNGYADIALPFQELHHAADSPFHMTYDWNREKLEGYLNTWSSVGNYIKEKGDNPVTPLMSQLTSKGLPANFPVTFPLFVRLFRL